MDEESVRARLDSLEFNNRQLAGRVRALEKWADVLDSPLWKLTVFVIDGWPLRHVVARPQWRPWRRWWTS